MTNPLPLRLPAPPKSSIGRCCVICGLPGGSGFTTALRLLGYDVTHTRIAYAHASCILRDRKKMATQRIDTK